MTTNSVTDDLDLNGSNAGDGGAQALGESLKINVTLEYLSLRINGIDAAEAQALAAGLLQNRGLRRLELTPGCGGDEGRKALKDAEKTKKERGENVWIWWH